MIEAAQIRAMLQQVTAFQISLDEFDGWLTRASWDMHKDSDKESISLVGAVEGCIAEFEQDHLSAHDLYGAFERMIGIVRLETEEPSVRIFASGSVDHGQQPITFQFEQSVDADKRFALEFSSVPPLLA